MANKRILQGGGGSHDSRSVANKIINAKLEAGVSVTHFQVQSLVYLAHAWTLVIEGSPLLSTPIQMSEFGASMPELYACLRMNGELAVRRPIHLPSWRVEEREYADMEDYIIRRVIDVYSDFSDKRLFMICNGRHSAWEYAYGCFLSEGQKALESKSAVEIMKAAFPFLGHRLLSLSPRLRSTYRLYEGDTDAVRDWETLRGIAVPDRLIRSCLLTQFSASDYYGGSLSDVKCCGSFAAHMAHTVSAKVRRRKALNPALALV